MSDPIFRTAGLPDAARLAELMTRTFRETYSEDHFGDARRADVEAYIAAYFGEERQRDELADPTLRTIIAQIDGELAGYVQLRDPSPTSVRAGPHPVEIARFYVDRPWHGRGVARAMMRTTVAAAANADPLWLGVFERNRRARAFYEKSGFVPAGRATFHMGEDVQNDWILVLASRQILEPLPTASP